MEKSYMEKSISIEVIEYKSTVVIFEVCEANNVRIIYKSVT